MTGIGLSVAFTAGLLSFLSPCIVPMLSVYFSLISGQSVETLQNLSAVEAIRKGVLRSTLAFIAGFTLVFTAAGVAAAEVGALFQRSLGVLNVVGGGFVIVLGLAMTGLIPQGFLQRIVLGHKEMSQTPSRTRTWASFLVGLFFAVACSHCIAPTLYSVLIYAGGTGSPPTGGALMFAFSLGLSIPYLLAGLFMGRVTQLLRKAKRTRRWVPRVAGVLMIGLGLFMVAGKLPLLTEYASKFWPFKPPVGM